MRNPFRITIRVLYAAAICLTAVCLLLLSAAAEEDHSSATLNVKDFGAMGDGVTDDTTAINQAASLLREGDTLYFPSGTYLLKEQGSCSIILIEGRKNVTVRLEKDATLQMDAVPDGSTGRETRHYIFHFLNCESITLEGGRLYGDRLSYTGDGFVQHGYAIRLADCKNATVRGVEIAHMRGDGISVFSDTTGEDGLRGRCTDVTIEDCHIYDCQRNGITLTSVIGCVIRNTEIHGIRGSLPQAAIDIEAEYPGSYNHNVCIESCHFYDNGSWSVTSAGDVANIDIISSTMEDRMTFSEETKGVRLLDSALGMVGIHCEGAYLEGCTVDGLCLYGGETTCVECRFDGDRLIPYRVLVTHREGVAEGRFESCEFYGRNLSALGGCIVFCHTPPASLTFSDCDFRSCGLIPFIGHLDEVEREGCFFDLGWACWLCILLFAAVIGILIFRRTKKRRWVCR